MLISSSKTTKTTNKLKNDNNRSRKLWTIAKQHKKLCRAQKLKMATKKSIGSILSVSPQPRVRTNLELGEIPFEGFLPMGKRRAGEPHGCFHPLLLKTFNSFTNTEPS